MHFRGGGIGHNTGHNSIAGNYVSPQLFRIVGYNPQEIDDNTGETYNTEDFDQDDKIPSEPELINYESDCEDNEKYIDILDEESDSDSEGENVTDTKDSSDDEDDDSNSEESEGEEDEEDDSS